MNKRRYLIIIGIVAAALLAILFDTMLVNHNPVITKVTVPERVFPLGNCQLTCDASDRDGDVLSYNWSSKLGSISGTGASVNWTAPDSQGDYSVTVKVTDGRGGEAMRQGIIEVRANRPPIIGNLTADAVWTLPSGTVQVTCTASDYDGDVLSYEWTAIGGSISGTGAVVNWSAPQEIGIYNVTVVVEDGLGGGDTAFVSLSVATAAPPIIEELTVTAKEPKYLKTTSSGYTVGRTKQYDIACNVSNTSGGVSYNWSCESGVISGQGPMITWTAPDERLETTKVTVIVSDVYGFMVTRSIAFSVASCTPCTFG